LDKETKTIIWDLDGTMLDSFGLYVDLLRDILPRHGMVLPDEDLLAKNYHGSLHESLGNSLGGAASEDSVNAIIDDFVREQNVHYEVVDHHLYQDALELAQTAKAARKQQVVVSNRDHINRLNASPRSIVERSELKEMISIVVSGDDSIHRKPNKEVIEHLLNDGIVVPEETVVIGDQFVDALFARNIGATAILVSRGNHQPEHMERLGDDWQSYVTIVSSLKQIKIH
jgi:HAD superfamily hydrolase (TIGR01549 family)